ncbi:DUF7344 domain-containing protein [Halomarina litorea]|uniref:DUF7344 domain-containing protein n=1 Tax=Halomarina litorea TaxID=2961595 RepID=UPI0020C52F39|nr:hypothetical protein [Halomarina sp. BCD28]
MTEERRPTGGTPDPDSLFDALRDDRRRVVVRALLERGERSVEDLVNTVVAHEGGDDTRRSVALSLVHRHLPRLADAGFVEYDGPTGTVVGTPTLAATEPHLRLVSAGGGTSRLTADGDPTHRPD